MSKKRIKVSLSKCSSQGVHPQEKIELFWDLHNTPIAEKYFEALKIASVRKFIYRRDRFYNFPNDYYTEQIVVDALNKAIDTINGCYQGLIQDRATLGMPQEFMNALHVYFEKCRGPMLRPSPLYTSASFEVREAFDELNLMIHRYEDLGYSGRAVSNVPKVQFTFGMDDVVRRYPLADEDFQHFTFINPFGTWFINYCEVGKPLHDIWRDRDHHVGSEVILPLRYYSADGLVNFGGVVSLAQHQKMRRDFDLWWDDHREKLESLGFQKDDPKCAIGSLPVAELDRNGPLLYGKTDREIVELISLYQWIDAVDYEEGPPLSFFHEGIL